MKLFSILALALAAASTPAAAQDCGRCADPVTVSVNFQVSLPGDRVTSGAGLGKALAGASQPHYEVISRQCDILADECKGACRIVQLNVNTSINDRRLPQFVRPGERGNAQQRVIVNANATFEITPADVDKPPAKP